MNREEYLKRLSFLLKDLPEEEIEDAIAYYEDYFEEAGEEKEEQVIKELGSPEKIARMIRDSVQGNQASTDQSKSSKQQSHTTAKNSSCNSNHNAKNTRNQPASHKDKN